MMNRTVFIASAFLLSTYCWSNEVLTIAHRGGAVFAPENTIPAFLANIDCSDLIELDVYESADGELFVIHDGTLNRTTDGSGPVGDATIAELKTLDAGSWYAPEFAGTRIPTLEEALAAIGTDAIPLIERKDGSAAKYVQLLQRINRTTDVVVQSFDWGFLKSMHQFDPQIPLAALGSGQLTEQKVRDIQSIGVPRVAWAHNDVTPAMIDFIHSEGMTLFVWTVNGTAIQKYIDYGVDGIITDDPGLVANLADPRPRSRQELADGIVSYWPLDDGVSSAGSVVAIDMEENNHGRLKGVQGLPGWVAGASANFGGALLLDGQGEYVEIPASSSLDLASTSVTISLWVRLMQKPSQISENYAGVFDSETDCYVVYMDRNNKELRFKVTDQDGKAARPGIPEAALSTGVWHHVVGVCNGEAGPVSGQALIYLDGQLMDVHSGADSEGNLFLDELIKTGQKAALGRNGDQGVYWFQGTIDDVAVWRRALTTAEIRQIYDAGMDGHALMRSVMDVRVVEIKPSNDLEDEIRVHLQVDHGVMEPGDLQIESAESVTGPFTPDGDSAVSAGDPGILIVKKQGLKAREFMRFRW